MWRDQCGGSGASSDIVAGLATPEREARVRLRFALFSRYAHKPTDSLRLIGFTYLGISSFAKVRASLRALVSNVQRRLRPCTRAARRRGADACTMAAQHQRSPVS